MFEQATRIKLRFTFKGQCTVEDLWDLSLENLDSIFIQLNSKKKEQTDASLLRKKNPKFEILELKIGIVKYIVNRKLEEREARRQAKEKHEKKQKIMEIIEDKEYESLKDKSIDELKSLVTGY